MRETGEISQRADSYVRGKLDKSAIDAFEIELLESLQLQDAVEDALGLQQLAKVEQKRIDSKNTVLPFFFSGHSGERPVVLQWSLAASVLMATVTSTLLWRSESENSGLQSQVAAFNQPVGRLISVPMDIMRTMDSRSPDVVIRMPAQASILALDVELDPALASAASLMLSLSNASGEQVFSWQASPGLNGRLDFAFMSTTLTYGKFWLTMRAANSDVVDERLLELLPPEH